MQQSISAAELSRLKKMALHEKRLAKSGISLVAGVDEAGRGPLAGPVVAAACILPKATFFAYLNDSKQVNAEMREKLFLEITNHPGVSFGIGVCDVETIDKVNILQATFLAMQKAVASLSVRPEYLLIDGNQTPFFDIPTLPLIKGDALSISIAAASIIAKRIRDRLMSTFDQEWPLYGFKKHKGYGTPEHLKALKEHGPCPLHRKSFEPVKSMYGNLMF